MKVRLTAALCAVGFILAAFVGCSAKDPGNTTDLRVSESTLLTNENAADDYYLSVISGQYYLTYREERGNIRNDLGSLSFDSLDQLVDKIRNNGFSESEHNVIRTAFAKDENGILLFDPNRLFDPVLPYGMQVNGVGWSGQYYSYSVSAVGSERPDGHLFVLPRQIYLSIIQREHETLLDQPQITVTSRWHTPERNAEVILYSTDVADLRLIRYTLPNGVIVEEEYRLRSDFSFAETSETAPLKISLYYEGEECCFYALVFGLSERPDTDWLSGFGLCAR